MSNDTVVDVLNDLIETCNDGAKGFEACANHSKAPELKTVFSTRASECRQAAQELETQVRAHGGKPEQGGSTAAAMHRGWMAVRTALTTHDDKALLEECERGEDAALKSYREALEETLPVEVRTLVARQAEGTQRNHDQIKALRNRYRAAA